MPRPLLRLAAAAGAFAACGACSAEPLAVKPGGWNMRAVGGPGAKPFDLKSCVTQEELQSMRAFQKDDDCKYTVTSSTSSRWAGTTVCGGKVRGEFEITAKGSEQIAMVATGRDGNGAARRFEITGKWASASCKGYDD